MFSFLLPFIYNLPVLLLPYTPATGGHLNTTGDLAAAVPSITRLVTCMANKSKRTKFKRFSKTTGLPPGTLIEEPTGRTIRTTVSFMNYDDKDLTEFQSPGEDILQHVKPQKRVSWIDIPSVQVSALIQAIGTSFNIHPLILEDIADPFQRLKFDDLDDYLFVEFNVFAWKEEDEEPSSQQVTLILTSTHVITFQEWNGDFFKPIKERLKASKGIIRKMGSEYLAYALIDYAVDTYYNVLEMLETKIDMLEDDLISLPDRNVLFQIQKYKKVQMDLRKATWPMREIVSKLETRDIKLVPKSLRIYIRDLYEHMIQVIDIIENQRELLSNMMDIYLSSTSNKLSMVMKTLTIISTIFIPLTFITSLYGMNFDFMPELDTPFGYPIVIAAMVVLSIVLLAIFKKRKWL